MLAHWLAICYTHAMKPEELLFKEALEFIEKDEISEARERLIRLLQLNRSNPRYWLWMSTLVDTPKETEFCLREVLKLDPKNATAVRGLRILGIDIDFAEPQPAIDPLKRQWKTSLEMEKPVEKKKARKRPGALSWAMLGIVALGITTLAVYLAQAGRYRPDTSPIMRFTLAPTLTPSPPTTPTPPPAGAAPLWTLLEATYTPTPVYAATPHKLTEAYLAAMRAYEKGDWPNALEFFRQVLATEPNSPDVHYHIGEIYRFQGMAEEAIAEYDASMKANASFAPAYLGKGRAQILANPKDAARARQNFEKALELDPGLAEALYELAALQLAAGDAGAALESIADYQETFPLTAQVELLRARACLATGDPAAGLTAAQNANQMDITLLAVYKVMAEAYQENEQLKASIEPLETYLAYESEDAEALAMMARALLETGKFKQAEEMADRALEVDERSVPALIVRGEILLRQKKLFEASESLDSALKIDETSFEVNILKSRIQLARDLNASAVEYARRAFELGITGQQQATALYWRAMAYTAQKQKAAARADLEELLQFPEDSLPAGLRQDAMDLFHQLVTPTPTLTRVVSATPTPTRTPRK